MKTNLWNGANKICFLSKEDRSALLVQNPDLSQFMTALEMCIKMQLAGIGSTLITRLRPQPLGKNIVSHTSICAVGAAYVFLYFLCIFIPIAIFVIYPWAQEEGYISIDVKPVRNRIPDDSRIAQYQVSIPLYLYVGSA